MFYKKILVFALLSLLMFCIDVCGHPFIITNPSGGHYFLGGPYTYRGFASTYEYNSYIADLENYGFTLVYQRTSINASVPSNAEIISACNSNGLKLIIQLDEAYFNPTDSSAEMDTKVQILKSYYNTYQSGSPIIAYCVNEETDLTDMPKLKTYISKIKAQILNISLYTIFSDNDEDAFNYARDNNMSFIAGGADFYRGSGTSLLTGVFSPWESNNILEEDCKKFRKEFTGSYSASAVYPVCVLSGNAYQSQHGKFGIWNLCGGDKSIWNDFILPSALDSNLGYSNYNDPYIKKWSHIRPAKNQMSCYIWLAVAKGFRTVLGWSGPTSTTTFLHMYKDSAGKAIMQEYGQTVRELQRFGKLINLLVYKASNTYATSPTGRVYIGNFLLSGKKVIAVVNGHIGIWCNSSEKLFSVNSSYHIDSTTGSVVAADYTALIVDRWIKIKPTNVADKLFDLNTGLELAVSQEPGYYSIPITPGKGKFIFVGTQADMNAARATADLD